MKKELVIPLGIAFIAGILIMLAGCGTSNPFNPNPNIFITSVQGADVPPPASGSATPGTANASFTISEAGPDIQIYTYTRAVNGGVASGAAAIQIDIINGTPNYVTKTQTWSYANYGGAPHTDSILETYTYRTVPGGIIGSFTVTYNVRYQ